jgi:hypothetical protein
MRKKPRRKSKYFYAAYRGDRFITVGTLDEVAEELDKERETVRFFASKAYHGRIVNYERSLLVYKYEIDEGDAAHDHSKTC